MKENSQIAVKKITVTPHGGATSSATSSQMGFKHMINTVNHTTGRVTPMRSKNATPREVSVKSSNRNKSLIKAEDGSVVGTPRQNRTKFQNNNQKDLSSNRKNYY